MKKVLIKYDPYEMKSIVIVDGREIQENEHCCPNLKRYLEPDIHMPIQSWIDPIDRDGWCGLLATICQMGDKDIVVEFTGRQVDYDSIKKSFKAQNAKLNANLRFCDLTDEIVPDLEMKKNIEEVIGLMLTDEFEKIVNDSNSEELIDKYANLKETYDEIEEEEFRIVFIGTYSSGKSSTINALIGKNILPTASGTCTAKICRIIHSKVEGGIANIRYLPNSKKGAILCKSEEEIQKKIENAAESVETIEVYTDLSKLYPKDVEGDFKLVIVDTPGTDSATGNDTEKMKEESKRLSKKSHIEITKEVLKSKQKEMVVLISDDKVEDDNIVKLLDIIEESEEKDDGAFNDRFLFVMNKCDSLAYKEEDTLDEYIKKFIANIKKVPNSARIRKIVNPRIFPITSGAALAVVKGYTVKPEVAGGGTKEMELYRYYKDFCEKIYYFDLAELKENFSEHIADIKTQYREYSNYCLEQKSSISEADKDDYIEELSGDLSLEERVLIHSGVPALKSAIHDYIKSYAYPIKMRQLLNCFTDILSELNALNEEELKALKIAKKDYSDAVSMRKMTVKEGKEEKKRRKRLLSVEGNMERVKKKVDEIKETIPEINEIRSEFYTIKNSIADKVGGRSEVLKEEGDKLIDEISEQIDGFLGTINDTVKAVKTKKKEATNELYEEFLSYLSKLEKEGFMTNGKFNLKDTVAYKKLVDKDNFTDPVESKRDEKNPKKEHIEFGYGIGNFFDSVGRAWKTRKEPKTVSKTYINIEKYVDENITPIQAEIDKYVEKLKGDYRSDMVYLKTETKKRVDLVIKLLKDKDTKILQIRKKASKIAEDEGQYRQQIEKLEERKKYLDVLITKLAYTQIR